MTKTPNLRTVRELDVIAVREGVYLRPLGPEDAGELLNILDADPSIRERVGVAARLYSVSDVETLLREESADTDILRYVICEHDKVVGMVNFWRAGDYFDGKADPEDYGFGYFLAPSARGRGLVTDSLRALMDVAVKNLPVKRFIAFCEADNKASGALLMKAGFEKTDVSWEESEHGWVERKYIKTV